VEERPPTEEITESVMKAQGAIADVIAHLQAGGSPTDDFVKAKMGDIKPAITKVSAAVEQRKGPKASVSVSVGGGDPKLGTYGMVSLVIEF
jgi:alcohol dehydrogenase class IV